MSNPQISVVMTAYKRAHLLQPTLESIKVQQVPDLEIICVEDGDDGGDTKALCAEYGVKYMQRKRRPDLVYSNPCRVNNIGLRAATGDVIILQNAECRHDGEVIRPLYNLAIFGTEAVFAAVKSLDEHGRMNMWYTHSHHNPRPFFFCGALLRKHFQGLRGFDEDFVYYGCDDNFFADCLQHIGVRFMYLDSAEVSHLWHPSVGADDPSSYPLYAQKLADLQAGRRGPISNLDHEWGQE